MDTKNIQKLTEYWAKIAEHDYETMLSLFQTKRYSDALFYGHMVLEKILKGLIVQSTQKQAPYIHDLVRLQEIAGLKLSEKEIDLLDEINDFNIRARYPEYKLRFYKLCTKTYTKNYIDKIVPLYQKLCQNLKRKK